MAFSTTFVVLFSVLLLALLIWKVSAILFAPYFVCKLPSDLGIVNFMNNAGNSSSFAVYCASNDSISDLLSLFPWESRGILSFKDDEIYYEGSRYIPRILRLGYRPLRNKTKRGFPVVRYKFDKKKVKISYIPAKFYRDGGLSWMRIEVSSVDNQNEVLYFTTGRSRLGIGDTPNSRSTKNLYKLVSEI